MGILQVPEWLPYGKDQHITGDNDPVYGVNGTINRCPKTLWSHLQVLAKGIDTLVVKYLSSTQIRVESGGVCWADDGVQGYQVLSNIDISLSSLEANSAYFLWIGEQNGNIVVKCGSAFNDTSVPSGLVHAHLIPGWFVTNSSGGIGQFSNHFILRKGEIIVWSAQEIPYGTIRLDGSAWPRFSKPFSNAYDLFGTSFGVGDGSTTFNLPDLRGRVCVGRGIGSGLSARSLGEMFGEEAHANVAAENGPHTHTGGAHTHTGGAHTHTGGAHTHTGGAHTHTSMVTTVSGGTAQHAKGGDGGVLDTQSGSGGNVATSSAGNVATSSAGDVATSSGGNVATSSQGSGTPHNNMQPSTVITYYIAL